MTLHVVYRQTMVSDSVYLNNDSAMVRNKQLILEDGVVGVCGPSLSKPNEIDTVSKFKSWIQDMGKSATARELRESDTVIVIATNEQSSSNYCMMFNEDGVATIPFDKDCVYVVGSGQADLTAYLDYTRSLIPSYFEMNGLDEYILTGLVSKWQLNRYPRIGATTELYIVDGGFSASNVLSAADSDKALSETILEWMPRC